MKKIYSLLFAALVVAATPLRAQHSQEVRAIDIQPNFNPLLELSVPHHPGDVNKAYEVEISSDVNEVRMPAPANDNCTGGLAAAYTLVPDAACTQGVTTGSTLESGETYGCITPNPTFSVWYSFVADATSMYVTVQGISGSTCSQNFGLRVFKYTGVCPPTTDVGCKDDRSITGGNGAGYIYSTVNLTSLTVGATYLIQITQQNCVASTRKFCIEVGHPTTCTSCSSTCGPECYYPSSSAPTVTWLQANCPLYPMRPPMNEFDTRTMCFTFTAPNSTVNLQLGNTTWCSLPGNTYSFNWACYSSTCGSPIASGSYTPTTISGMTVGQNYVLCYTWQSACSWESAWPYIYAANLLPIELVSFEAKPGIRDIDVYWTTASETNTSEFVIEKTTDGQNFFEVDRVNAAGNSSSIINYRVKDRNPHEGNNYYRLKEIDIDGKIIPGEITAAYFRKDFTGLSVRPNPAQNEIAVNFISVKDASVSIVLVDSKGAVVHDYRQLAGNDGLNNVIIDIASLPQGIYSVRLAGTDENLSSRFIKQ
jgi:hypothetical protein